MRVSSVQLPNVDSPISMIRGTALIMTKRYDKTLKLSKLKKGDKLHVKYDDKEIIITITHIEMEKGTPTVNFKCSGNEDINISTEFKGKSKKDRSNKLHGSNKGRGWSKGSNVVKK